MPAEPQEHETPYESRVVSRTTLCEIREDPLAPWPPDYLAVFIRYTATFRCEARFTGGNIPRAAITHDHEDTLVHLFDAEDLRSEATVRAAVRKELRKLLELAEYYGYRTADGGEDAFVPPGLVDRILAGAAAVPPFANNDDDPDLWTVRHICDVSMEVDVTNVYSETKALMLLCSAVSGGPGRRDIGSQQCPVCMQELAADDATSFPECSHAFHRGCILDSLRRAPTCPSCRHDLMQDLPHQCRVCRAYWISQGVTVSGVY